MLALQRKGKGMIIKRGTTKKYSRTVRLLRITADVTFRDWEGDYLVELYDWGESEPSLYEIHDYESDAINAAKKWCSDQAYLRQKRLSGRW